MAAKSLISVHVKVAGFIDKRMIAAEFDLEVPPGITLKKLFRLADKSGNIEKKTIKKIMALPRPPTVLVNGLSIDVPEELGKQVMAGDEVAVMTPLGGG